MAPDERSPETERVVEELGFILIVAVSLPWLAFVVLDVEAHVAMPSLLGLRPVSWTIVVLFLVSYPLVSRSRTALSGSERARRVRERLATAGIDSQDAIARVIAIIGAAAVIYVVLVLEGSPRHDPA